MRALVRQKKGKICVSSVPADQVKRPHLRRAKADFALLKVSGGLFKGELLVQGAGSLIAVPAGFFYHAKNGYVCGRDGRGTLADIDTLGSNSFSMEIIGPRGASLHHNGDDRLSVHGFISALYKHGDVRANRVTQSIRDPKHRAVNILHAAHGTIIIHPDI